MTNLNIKSGWVIAAGLIFLASLGCNSKNNSEAVETDSAKNTPSEAKKDPVLPEFGSTNGDTINVFGPFALFYGPEPVSGETDLSISDELKAYAQTRIKIIDSLKQNSNISPLYTTVNCIRVFSADGKSMILMRNTFIETTGLILSDWRQSPVINKGTFTEEAYHSIIQRYFLRPS